MTGFEARTFQGPIIFFFDNKKPEAMFNKCYRHYYKYYHTEEDPILV
jgi:hypothetical protein